MARVTIYLPDGLHQRWREESDVNLSKVARKALTEVLESSPGSEPVNLCDICQHRVALTLGFPVASAGTGTPHPMTAEKDAPNPPGGDPDHQARFGRRGGESSVPSRNGTSAA